MTTAKEILKSNGLFVEESGMMVAKLPKNTGSFTIPGGLEMRFCHANTWLIVAGGISHRNIENRVVSKTITEFLPGNTHRYQLRWIYGERRSRPSLIADPEIVGFAYTSHGGGERLEVREEMQG